MHKMILFCRNCDPMIVIISPVNVGMGRKENGPVENDCTKIRKCIIVNVVSFQIFHLSVNEKCMVMEHVILQRYKFY